MPCETKCPFCKRVHKVSVVARSKIVGDRVLTDYELIPADEPVKKIA